MPRKGNAEVLDALAQAMEEGGSRRPPLRQFMARNREALASLLDRPNWKVVTAKFMDLGFRNLDGGPLDAENVRQMWYRERKSERRRRPPSRTAKPPDAPAQPPVPTLLENGEPPTASPRYSFTPAKLGNAVPETRLGDDRAGRGAGRSPAKPSMPDPID